MGVEIPDDKRDFEALRLERLCQFNLTTTHKVIKEPYSYATPHNIPAKLKELFCCSKPGGGSELTMVNVGEKDWFGTYRRISATRVRLVFAHPKVWRVKWKDETRKTVELTAEQYQELAAIYQQINNPSTTSWTRITGRMEIRSFIPGDKNDQHQYNLIPQPLVKEPTNDNRLFTVCDEHHALLTGADVSDLSTFFGFGTPGAHSNAKVTVAYYKQPRMVSFSTNFVQIAFMDKPGEFIGPKKKKVKDG